MLCHRSRALSGAEVYRHWLGERQAYSGDLHIEAFPDAIAKALSVRRQTEHA